MKISASIEFYKDKSRGWKGWWELVYDDTKPHGGTRKQRRINRQRFGRALGRRIAAERAYRDARPWLRVCGSVSATVDFTPDAEVGFPVAHVPEQWVDELGQNPRPGPMRCRVALIYPLNAATPEELRSQEHVCETPRDLLIAIATMYQQLYVEDAKLGGITAAENRRRLEEEGQEPHLWNRPGTGPYIWGHDLTDLWFEGLDMEFTGPDTCIVKPRIGS